MKRKTLRRTKSARGKSAGSKAGKTGAKGTAVKSRIAAPRATRGARHAEKAAKPADLIGTLVTADAQALGIAIEPAWRPGVVFNLGLIFRLAALVDEFPLPDDTEPGPVFHA